MNTQSPSDDREIVTGRLVALEAIRALKARYFRCMDTKDWAGLRAVFTDDLIADFRDSTPPRNEALLVEGADAYLAMLVPYLDKMTTVHQGFSPEVEITSETTATGIWAMEDVLRAEPGAPVPYRTYHGWGHYHETYERQGGEWRIKTIRLSRLRVDVA